VSFDNERVSTRPVVYRFSATKLRNLFRLAMRIKKKNHILPIKVIGRKAKGIGFACKKKAGSLVRLVFFFNFAGRKKTKRDDEKNLFNPVACHDELSAHSSRNQPTAKYFCQRASSCTGHMMARYARELSTSAIVVENW
jgi:hypothetical protein